MTGRQLSLDYRTIEKAIHYIENYPEMQPSPVDIAASVNLSEFHFQKLFSRWVGISPERFLQFLTKEYAEMLLDESKNMPDVTYAAGLSGPGRLHDLFMHCEAVTPGEYKSKGSGLEIIYGFSYSPFGTCMIANTQRGICALKFVKNQNRTSLSAWLEKQWPQAVLKRKDTDIQQLAEIVFPFDNKNTHLLLHLYVKGTNFQIKVWEALALIPFGQAVTYQDIARYIGHPNAVRAVGTAIGKNPIPFLIPCHRVIQKTGNFGSYGEGRARKKALIGWEAAKRSSI